MTAPSRRIGRLAIAGLLAVALAGPVAAADPRSSARAERPPEPEWSRLMREVHDRRHEIDGLFDTCMAPGWGWRLEYAEMTLAEARLRGEALGAAHRDRAAALESCHRSARDKAEALRRAAAALAVALSRAAADDPRLEEVGDLVRRVAERVSGTADGLLPRLIAVERAVADFFAALGRTPLPIAPDALTEPPHIVRLEALVAGAMRSDVALARQELETLERIWPAPPVRALLATARIQEAIARVADRTYDVDDADEVGRLLDVQDGLRRVGRMVVQAAADPRVRELFPAAGPRYAAILAGVLRLHEHVDSIQVLGVNRGQLAPDRAPAAALEYRQRIRDIARLGQLIDAELHALTRIFRAGMAQEAMTGR
jgi:hypothetical protein